ncbi:molybdenum cofactor sulfurase-like isoform X2 [Antedon mediterranea]|uniref:molybdenum cofactor sulfurase-like isoform X2 n=1 Tax=Antedon mediterranea TaxID=105859 RepID=UPI003AF93F13
MNDNIEIEFPLLQDVVYLDHAAATLYARRQLDSYMQDISNHIYGNPHSRSQSSQLTSEVVENVRERILNHFGTSSEYHSVIFTANSTGAIKLVAETFQWNRLINENRRYENDGLNSNKGILYYLEDSHTSVVGMREYALKHGADFNCISERAVLNSIENLPQVSEHDETELPNCLFAYPAQSNFSGRKFPLNWANNLKRNEISCFVGRCGRWCVLLDAASYVMTSKLDLSLCNADFVPMSFYKMFGFPTGIGALIISNESASFLRKTFFGGGTVQAYSSTEHFHVPKVNIHEWFEDGTLPFLDIIALRHGFDTLQGLAGGMHQISHHTFALAKYVHHELASYCHSNSKPVAKLYHENNFEDINIQGAIVNFNIIKDNGDYVGYSEVDKLANLYSIQLRTGCFCNTGACQKFLGLTSDKVKKNFEAGHKCGDDKDLIDGQPTGSVRISFGYMSSWKDAKRFLQFIRECFMSTNPEPCETRLRQYAEPVETRTNLFLYKMFLYPVKSCGAMEVKEWNIGSRGFLFDREWMIVNENGVALTQKRTTNLCCIKPNINLKENTLILNAKGKTPMTVPLECDVPSSSQSLCQSRVCMHRVQGIDCGQEVSDWLTDVLGQRCRLIKKNNQYKRLTKLNGEAVEVSFANESQFLLLNKASLDHLLECIQQRDHIIGVKKDDIDCQMDLNNLIGRFRANFVFASQEAFQEDNWKVVGPCTRCQMVCVDQETGARGKEPLQILSKLRGKRMSFGVYLHLASQELNGKLSTSDSVRVVHNEIDESS